LADEAGIDEVREARAKSGWEFGTISATCSWACVSLEPSGRESGGLLLASRVVQEESGERWTPILEDADQRSTLEVFGDALLRDPSDGSGGSSINAKHQAGGVRNETQKLGRLEVSELGFGNMTLSGGHYGPGVDRAQGIRQIREAHERGRHVLRHGGSLRSLCQRGTGRRGSRTGPRQGGHRGAEAKRAFDAMLPMKKIDIATIEAARRG
jgi:hypothetical protein